jgi:ABC-type transporter Mla subunit MlaD
MTLSRATTIVVLGSALLLAGCSDSDSGSDTGSTSAATEPTPTPTSAAAIAWADGVCSASTELQESVRAVRGTLQFDPSTASLGQARQQVRDSVTAVQQAATSLGTALAASAGSGSELAAAQQELQAASQQAKQGADELGAAAGQVTDARTPAQLATNLGALKAALSGAANDLETYLATLRSTVTGGGQAVQDTFNAAPACQAAIATPTPS